MDDSERLKKMNNDLWLINGILEHENKEYKKKIEILISVIEQMENKIKFMSHKLNIKNKKNDE